MEDGGRANAKSIKIILYKIIYIYYIKIVIIIIKSKVEKKKTKKETFSGDRKTKDGLDIQIKAIEQCFSVVLFIMLYQDIQSFESVDYIPQCTCNH